MTTSNTHGKNLNPFIQELFNMYTYTTQYIQYSNILYPNWKSFNKFATLYIVINTLLCYVRNIQLYLRVLGD